jgi:hypothetical protein
MYASGIVQAPTRNSMSTNSLTESDRYPEVAFPQVFLGYSTDPGD